MDQPCTYKDNRSLPVRYSSLPCRPLYLTANKIALYVFSKKQRYKNKKTPVLKLTPAEKNY